MPNILQPSPRESSIRAHLEPCGSTNRAVRHVDKFLAKDHTVLFGADIINEQNNAVSLEHCLQSGRTLWEIVLVVSMDDSHSE
jgi:hypothetical protein